MLFQDALSDGRSFMDALSERCSSRHLLSSPSSWAREASRTSVPFWASALRAKQVATHQSPCSAEQDMVGFFPPGWSVGVGIGCLVPEGWKQPRHFRAPGLFSPPSVVGGVGFGGLVPPDPAPPIRGFV